MDLDNLAPWIAIAITMALSILVPLFTQIANNAHQRKMHKERIRYEQSQYKRETYEEFMLKVGGIVTAGPSAKSENIIQAGAALHRMYIYAPKEWHVTLDNLTYQIGKYEWDKAKHTMQEISRWVSENLNENKVS